MSVCRVCLAGDTRLHSLKNNRLLYVYEQLSKTKFNSEDARPRAVCCYCHQKLLRCLAFSQMARRSENIFSQLFRKGLEANPENITEFKLGMEQHLSVATMPPIAVNMTNESSLGTFQDEPISVTEEMTTEEDVPISVKEEMTTEEDVPISVKEEMTTEEVEPISVKEEMTTEEGPISVKEEMTTEEGPISAKEEMTTEGQISVKEDMTTEEDELISVKEEMNTDQLVEVKYSSANVSEDCIKSRLIFEEDSNLGNDIEENSDQGNNIEEDSDQGNDIEENSHQGINIEEDSDQENDIEELIPYTYVDKNNLDDYMNLVIDTDKPFGCYVCDEHFSNKTSLKSHMRIHNDGKPV